MKTGFKKYGIVVVLLVAFLAIGMLTLQKKSQEPLPLPPIVEQVYITTTYVSQFGSITATNKSSGTGTLIDGNHVLTAKHVVDGNPTLIEVRVLTTFGLVTTKAIDVLSYKGTDIALLELELIFDAKVETVFAPQDAVTKEKVHIIAGFPSTGYLGPLYREGYIMTYGIRTVIDRRTGVNYGKLTIADLAIFGGDSGSGVYNTAGQLVGVISIMTRERWAGFVPISQFREIL